MICRRALSSRWFLLATFAWFIIGCIIIALTSKYPMAFDENWHMGLIKIYAQHLLPFGIEKTADMATYGAATSDPSYLFHYLMSFPYRAFIALGINETAAIIGLRLLNIGFFVAALMIFRIVLRQLHTSRALSNSLIAVITLLPVVPLLASEVNYDNLLLVFVGLLFWVTIAMSRELGQTRSISLMNVLAFIAISLLGGSVKYAFLPLVAASGLWLIALMIYEKLALHTTLLRWRTALTLPDWKLIALIISVVLGGVFFSRDVYNLAVYHKISPPCDYFFSVSDCENYGPWARDYHHRQNLATKYPDFHPKSYPEYLAEDWVPGMTMRLFFTLAGPGNNYQTREALPVPIVVFSVLFWLGFCGALVFTERIIRARPIYLYGALLIVVYCAALSFEVYSSYRATAEPVAINGRYLIPLAIWLGLMVAAGWRHIARALHFETLLPVIAAVCLSLVTLQGGGAMTYFALSYPHWFYDGAATDVTNWLRAVFSHLVPTNWAWEKLFKR